MTNPEAVIAERTPSATATRLKNLAKRRARQPYTRGWRAPWRKSWGVFSDGHTRLAKLAKTLEREILDDYVVRTRGEERAVWRAARFLAIAEMMLDKVNGQERVIVSRTTKPAAVAERILSRLPKRRDVPPPSPSTPAELLEQVRRELGTNGRATTALPTQENHADAREAKAHEAREAPEEPTEGEADADEARAGHDQARDSG